MTVIHFQSIESHLLDFDDRLLAHIDHIDPKALEMIRPHIQNQGKHIRPALVYLCAEVSGNPDYSKCHKYAAVVEMIHIASLFHDDVLDEATSRRNKPTPNKLWGNDLAVLAGDLLYVTALSLMTDESTQLRSAVQQTVSDMTEAELVQGLHRFRVPDKETYFKIIEGKTASLISLAALLGASATDQQKTKEFAHFGLKIGLIFQVIDDLLDWQKSSEMGKKQFQDLIEGRVTFPLISLLEQLSPSKRKKLSSLINDLDKSSCKDTVNYCLALMEEQGTFKSILSFVTEITNECIEFLNGHDDSVYKDDLLRLTQMIVSRDN